MPVTTDTIILADKLYLMAERCKGCYFCVEFCPKHVFFISLGFNSRGYHPPGVDPQAKCTNCKLCELLCPEFAIYSSDVARNGVESVAQPAQEAQP